MIKFILFFVVSFLIIISEKVDAIGEHTLVDELTAKYLNDEIELWKIIEKREDRTLQHIHDIHTTILNRDYGESNVFLRSIYFPNSRVIGSIMAINDTSHDIAREFFEHRNYTALSIRATNGINLGKIFDGIYEETVNSTEFWSNLKNISMDCHPQTRIVQSENQIIFEYYKEIQAVALRTYVTAQLSYMILHLHESGEFHDLAIINEAQFRKRNAEIRKIFKMKLRHAKRDVWTCDPSDYNESGVNQEITKFLQGYIDNEVNLNAEGSCTSTCSDYQNTRHHECRPDTLCAAMKPHHQKIVSCKGKVRGCYTLDDELNVCPSDMPNSRYKYVKTSDDSFKLGNVSSCSNEVKMNAWVRWFVKCSNCFCLCDDEKDSDRYFSLLDVVSKIDKNKVITGAYLTKINHVIQFVISEHFLGPNGKIIAANDEVMQWRSGPLFEVNDNRSRNGIDFHTLTFDHRSVNLDTIIAPIGQVVTGVRFHRNTAGRLHLEIRATDVDLATGQLINLEKSIWLSNPSGGKHRINTDLSDISIRSPKPSVPNHKDDCFIRFGPTHNRIDISQRTVPFIESMKIQPKILTPLSGIGLYHKGQRGYGGFLAAKLIVYNFEPHIEKIEK